MEGLLSLSVPDSEMATVPWTPALPGKVDYYIGYGDSGLPCWKGSISGTPANVHSHCAWVIPQWFPASMQPLLEWLL